MNNLIKTFEKFNQLEIDLIEDLFVMYFDEWGAVRLPKSGMQGQNDLEYYKQIPITYKLELLPNLSSLQKDTFKCIFFITPNSVNMNKFLSDVNKFIERVRTISKSKTLSVEFKKSGKIRNHNKQVYIINFKL